MSEFTAAEVVLPCARLAETLEFFVESLGFRVAAIFPADGPRVAVIAGHGLRLRLEQGRTGDAGTICLRCAGAVPADVVAPNGTRIEFVAADPAVVVPPLQGGLVVTRMDGSAWGDGRAGMGYRDLIPGRLGGRFIASHIRIAEDGPVPDYVHFHRIRFQIIYCVRGAVQVVYEDQGPAFVLAAGELVVQPPGIRHRVLASAGKVEVVEVTCPAEHETIADLELTLPNEKVDHSREFAGQRFHHYRVEQGEWGRWRVDGFRARDTGVLAATDGVGAVHVVRPGSGVMATPEMRHDAELVFLFVLGGAATLQCEGQAQRLGAGGSAAIPAGMWHALVECTEELELLEVCVPGAFTTTVRARG